MLKLSRPLTGPHDSLMSVAAAAAPAPRFLLRLDFLCNDDDADVETDILQAIPVVSLVVRIGATLQDP